MADVVFMGLLRMKAGVSRLEVDADSVKELIVKICDQLSVFSEKDLKQAVIFVNDTNVTRLKMYKTKLKKTDEVIFMSPVSGG